VWHKGLQKLFLISDDGWISRMDLDGGNKYTWYVESADYEGLTIANHSSNYVYVATEQTQILIKEFDVSTGSLTGKTWRLTEMEGSGNAGLEALTFVPNGFHPYADSTSGGLFYAGKEADGKIYVYDVNLSVSGSVTYKGTITPVSGRTAIGGLHFESETGVLYVMYRDDQLVREIEPDGTFIAEYSRPNGGQEGITVIPSCPSSYADMVIANDGGPVTLYHNYPVACLGGSDDFVSGPWLQNVTPSGISVVWEADQQESFTPTVAYGLTESCELGTVNAAHASVNGYHVYSATLSGLSGNTVYYYRVTSGASQSDTATFKSAPAQGSSGFRFYDIGDIQGGVSECTAINEMICADMSEYPEHHQTFILDTGDTVDNGGTYSDWVEFWDITHPMFAYLPVYVSVGNHEDRNSSASEAFIRGYFDFPYAASGSTDEKWYSFDYGNVHCAAMAIFDDGGFASGAQKTWIQADLAAASADPQTDWIFALMHFIPWSLGDHDSSEAASIQTYLHPIFSSGGVDCAFGGHNHLYARYAPIDGVTYITSGGAGGGLHTGSYTAWAGGTLEASAQVNHFCVVDVEEDVVAVRAIGLDGTRLDYVTFGGTPSNRPPFADAGADVETTVGSPVTLNGAASEDPEGAGISYAWSQVSGPPVTLSGGSSSSPSFTTAVPDDYLFELRVHDGTYWSAPDFCSASVDSGTLTFTPEADTYIDDLNPAVNYGTSTQLRIDTSPNQFHTYVRFNVAGLSGEVVEATLRVYCTNPGNTAEIRTCSDTDWAETSPTWNSPLIESGATVGSLSTTATSAWAEADVTDAVTGNGKITLVILPGGSDGVAVHSRENTNKPQLVVRYRADLSSQDSDSDGLSDYDEICWDGDADYHAYPAGGDTSTTSADTDGDGLSDLIEAESGGDPVNPAAVPPVIRVNFQPASSSPPPDYCPDGTEGYSARGYGWR
jgi:hypothetical protein